MKFRLAAAPDDLQLRQLLRDTVVPGQVQMIYAREPGFFDSFSATGGTTQVIVADDNNQIMAAGCRTIKELFVNGEPAPVGYLSGLRLADSVQNGTVLARGYSFLKNLHNDHKTRAYLTTIIHGNEYARQMLTSKRAGLPSYLPLGDFVTHVIPVRIKPRQSCPLRGLCIESGESGSSEEVREFLNQHGSRRQFFPVSRTDGGEKDGLASIGLADLLVARKDGKIAGVIAVWNQEQYKQYIIAGYSRLFRRLCPAINTVLRICGFRPLPPAGEQLRFAVAALVCIRNDDPLVFRCLLRHALNKAAAAGLHQFAIGLHEHDPFCPSMKRFFHIKYRSWLYLVSWEDNSFYESLDKNRVPYLEIGTL